MCVVCNPPHHNACPNYEIGRGVTEGKGGEDKHERGIEMTKNEVEIHLILFYSFYYVE